MADTYELLLKLGADVGEIKNAQSELVRLQRQLQGWGETLKQGLSFGIGSRIIDGIAQIPSFISSSVSAYARQEAAEAGLANAMRATGISAAENIEAFRQMAAEIQRATAVGDEQVLELQKMALNMGVSKERMRECIEGAIGLQHAYGMGLNEALKASAAVLQGNTQRLNELIPALRNCKDDEERLAMASQAMRNGFAQAQDETKTLRGALAQLSNAWGDVSEVVGSAVAPVVKEFASLLKILAEALANNRGGTVFLTRAIVVLMAALALSKMARYLSAIKGITAAKIADTVATVANTAAVNANTGAQAANATAAAKVAHAITASRAVLMALGTTTVGFGVIVAGVLASVAFAWSRIEGEIQKVREAEDAYTQAVVKHSAERLGKVDAEYNSIQKFGAEFGRISEFSKNAEYEMQRAIETRNNLQRQGLDTKAIDAQIERYNQMITAVWQNVDALEELRKTQRENAFNQLDELDKKRLQDMQASAPKTAGQQYNETVNALTNSGFKLEGIRRSMETAEASQLPQLVEQYKRESEIYAKLAGQKAKLEEQLNLQRQRREQTVSAAAEKLDALKRELEVDAAIASAELAGDEQTVQRLQTERQIEQLKRQIVSAGKHQYMTADELKQLESDALKIAREKVALENRQNDALKERQQLKNKEAAQEDYIYRTKLAQLKLQGDEEGVKRLERVRGIIDEAKRRAEQTGETLQEAIQKVIRLKTLEEAADEAQKERSESGRAETAGGASVRQNANGGYSGGGGFADGEGVRGPRRAALPKRARGPATGTTDSSQLFNLRTGLRNNGTSMSSAPSMRRSENPSASLGGRSQSLDLQKKMLQQQQDSNAYLRGLERLNGKVATNTQRLPNKKLYPKDLEEVSTYYMDWW